MKYESEFEIVETINSSVTKKQHIYTLFYKVMLQCGNEESSLVIWDMHANHLVGGVKPRRITYLQEKLELGYVLYTTTNIHPFHLYFFHDIPREMWKGFLYGKAHEHKKYKTAEWYDLLYPLPFYPNLQGFCHRKSPLVSCSQDELKDYIPKNDLEKFSLEWTIHSLSRYNERVPKWLQQENDVLVEANSISHQSRHFKVISS